MSVTSGIGIVRVVLGLELVVVILFIDPHRQLVGVAVGRLHVDLVRAIRADDGQHAIDHTQGRDDEGLLGEQDLRCPRP